MEKSSFTQLLEEMSAGIAGLPEAEREPALEDISARFVAGLLAGGYSAELAATRAAEEIGRVRDHIAMTVRSGGHPGGSA